MAMMSCTDDPLPNYLCLSLFLAQFTNVIIRFTSIICVLVKVELRYEVVTDCAAKVTAFHRYKKLSLSIDCCKKMIKTN